MQLNALTNVEIPFGKLISSSENVRATRGDEQALEQLAASIQAVGLLQSLIVQPASRGKFAVVAGERRWAALSILREAGQIQASYKVPCRLLPKDADPAEASLAENVQREDMEALDECAAFHKLIDKGHSVPDIAARFGYSETLVERRLALARLSPFLLERYRQGQATLELLQAFTLTGDHTQQEQVWEQLPEWNRKPDAVRRLLSQKDIPASDPQVRFVTLAAYEAAGGHVKRDLFADEDGNGVYLTDADILQHLVAEKLQQAAQKVQKDGWQWVEIQPDTDFQALSKFRRLPGEPAPLPKKQESKRAQLADELDALSAQLDGHEEETEECQRLYERVEQLQDEIAAIDHRRPVVFPDGTRQTCGVIVSLDESGEIRLHEGLLRKEDETALRARVKEQQMGSSTEEPKTATTSHGSGFGYSAALLQSLTTIKTAAIAVELAQQPRIALATVVYTLIQQEFGFELHEYRLHSSLHLSLTTANLREVESTAPAIRLSELRQEIFALLPPAETLWTWCLAQSEETLLRLLAYCAATAVSAIQVKGQSEALRLAHAERLAQALELDMTRWFTPTADNFFNRISKPQIAQALREAGRPAENETLALKKAQLAAAAESKLAGTGWLPEPLRIATEPTE